MSFIFRSPKLLLAKLALILVAAACGDTEVEPAKRTVASVAVVPGTRTLVVGESYAYEGRPLDLDGELIAGIDVRWVSTNPLVASIANDGTVTALAAGTTTIAASAEGKTGTAQLVVNEPAVADVAVSPLHVMLIEGETQTLTATARDAAGRVLTGRTVVWTTDDATVATVDAAGTVTAKARGSANITAQIEAIKATIDVTVNRTPVATITASPTGLVLEIGQTRQLTAVTRDAAGNVLTGRIVTWSTDRPSVATVSNSGLVTAVGAGYVTILVASEGVTFSIGATIAKEEGLIADLLYHRTAQTESEIFTLDPTTGAAPTRINAGNVSRQPTASPNGKRIAFAVSQIELGTNVPIDDIFAVDRNGMNMKRLTTAAGAEDHPAWSPAGDRIAYRHFEGARADIWVMNADGTGQRNLTADISPQWMLGAPSWSPDGQRLTFAGTINGVAGTDASIWTMNVDGSNKKTLTTTRTGFDGAPSWSPDGLRIAFVRFYDGDADIAIVSSAGGEVTRVPVAGNQSTPAWSPDGALIAFAQQNSGRFFIYTMTPNGTDVRLRTSAGGSEPAWIAKP